MMCCAADVGFYLLPLGIGFAMTPSLGHVVCST